MYRLLLFSLLLAGCKATQPAASISSEADPGGVVLTVIFRIDPQLDTLTVYDIIRAPGRLRAEREATVDAQPGDIRFNFLDANGRSLRQLNRPYPQANRYEGPGETGEIQTAELPDEPRSLVLKTQDSQRLRWLDVAVLLPTGVEIRQRINLKPER